MPDQTKPMTTVDATNKTQMGQALVIQTYATSVNEQPPVDFSGIANLSSYQTQINDGLTTAQTHATNYLNVVQPALIANMSAISNYCSTFNAVAAVSGTSQQQWVTNLGLLLTQSNTSQSTAQSTLGLLQTLETNLSSDAAAFSTAVSDLNTAVSGDNGVLSTLKGEVKTVQDQIDGAIAGSVVSALAIVGGGFLAAVGGVSDFVTAGTTTPLIIGGIAIAATGVAGETAAATQLNTLNNKKARLLQEEATLQAEVKLALGISTAYESFHGQVLSAVSAAQDMVNAWTSLGSDVGKVIDDLNKGVMKPAEAVLWANAAQNLFAQVTNDINLITQQMAGATPSVAPSGQTVGQAIVAAAAAQQSAAA
jgi:non-hemolytic enterotoxin B/C